MRSHVFCSQCADITGLSRSPDANRVCPACQTQLFNPNDVVVSGLNPSEDYKTSVLSGLSPTIIMECASRALAFYSYQASQEIVYQEHLGKSLTERYATLSQHMDHVIQDANAQIKMLQDKIQVMHDEQISLEEKNFELLDAYRDKSKAQKQLQKMYQSLKAQVMATHVASAAGDEAEYALNTVRGDRCVDILPGVRSGTSNLNQHGPSPRGGTQQKGGMGLGSQRKSQIPGLVYGGRVHTGCKSPSTLLVVSHVPSTARLTIFLDSAPSVTPLQPQARRSQLPVLGGTRQSAGPSHQPSPMIRQPLGSNTHSQDMNFGLGTKLKGRAH